MLGDQMAGYIVQVRSFEHPDAVHLCQLQRLDIADRYARVDSEPGVVPSAQDMTLFCVAYDRQGTPVGCGGLRQLAAHRAEIKRMFVVQHARGSGAATAVLVALEQSALQNGYTELVLETGDRLLDAIRFYRRSGYQDIANFGYYEGIDTSICMLKRLTRAK